MSKSKNNASLCPAIIADNDYTNTHFRAGVTGVDWSGANSTGIRWMANGKINIS